MPNPQPPSSCETSIRAMRRIYEDVLPRSQYRLERSGELVSRSIGRELETTQRIFSIPAGNAADGR
jgi:hypothetical protein